MANDIAQFLLARIAEDEQIARLVREREKGSSYPPDNGPPWPCDEQSEHVAVGPARVLAECEVKRRIVALHAMESGPSMYYNSPDAVGCQTCTGCGVNGDEFTIEGPCPTVLALALPYADHPDHDPTWLL